MRKVLNWTVVAFLVFYLLSQPVGSAHAVKSLGAGLLQAATRVGVFFNNLAA